MPTPAAEASLRYFDALIRAGKEAAESGALIRAGKEAAESDDDSIALPVNRNLDALRAEASKLLKIECASGDETNKPLHVFFLFSTKQDMRLLDLAVQHLQQIFAPETIGVVDYRDWLCARAED